MGGSQSQEFMVRTAAGEDQVVSCEQCSYAANMEKATSKLAAVEDLSHSDEEEVCTPGMKTIEDVARYLNVAPSQTIKALMYVSTLKGPEGDGKTPVVLFLRGDHTFNETKGSSVFPPGDVRPMTEEEIIEVFGSPPGFIGPARDLPWRKLGKMRLLVYYDEGLRGRTNLVAGANKKDYHRRNVTLFDVPGSMFGQFGKWDDFVAQNDATIRKELDIRSQDILEPKEPTPADLRSVKVGEACPSCGAPLRIDTAVEIGHIFKLGYKYSNSMGARVLDHNGKEVAPIMGSYGIGIERILTAAVEQSNDENGFWLPPSIAPFEVVVVATNSKDEAIRATSEQIARELEAAGYDVLLDERNERPGVKFKDADLVGIPFRVNVGKKVTEGTIEVVRRSTLAKEDVKISAITEHFQDLRPAAR